MIEIVLFHNTILYCLLNLTKKKEFDCRCPQTGAFWPKFSISFEVNYEKG